ncbi:Retrovirus-related Pol polyprotein from type-2 retrotransposable element R2DM [Araneus ventricosus]|uniref:Retrovirus-related Pol polyprotein from type-2 retrotransposable element R2DM n=1 Tax=Araneus ventricosus TaxID=182803 RepID=A0A4Y2KYR5_ARAVE|nr:Retrovirus-related Pol polyprotein from type-2 retrotransposable element R2DM [Araneus ventricosus]
MPFLQVSVPLWRLSRLGGLGTVMSGDVWRDRQGVLAALMDQVKHTQLTDNSKSYFSDKLYQSIDGRALSDSAKVKGQNDWTQSKNKFLSGRDYINLIKTRINCLPTASRCVRGRPEEDKYCRAGCPRKETLNHISQSLPANTWQESFKA